VQRPNACKSGDFTSVSKLEQVLNSTNSLIIEEFCIQLRANDSSERYQNKSLVPFKIIVVFLSIFIQVGAT
jgi:hypothetical protein